MIYVIYVADVPVRDIAVSEDTSVMCGGGLVSFVADHTRDTSGLLVGTGTERPLILFPVSGALFCLLRVGHSETSVSYMVQIVGTHLHCQQGIMDVFIQDDCAQLGHNGVLFRECTWSLVKMQGDGTTLCTYICTPLAKSDTTFIRVTKARHMTDSYENWSIHSIKLIRIQY